MASSVDARLLKSTKFPVEFNQKVDMQKVNLQVMKKWIARKISEILQNEDDVVIELCFNLIEGTRFPDIKALQIQLTGFLDKDTAPFCKELWKLLLSAQTSPQGVPKELLEAKKLELMQEKMEADKAAEDTRRRREEMDRRDREIADLKERDRRDIRARGNFRQGRGGGRAFEDRGRGGQYRNRSRSRDNQMGRDERDKHGRDMYGRDADRYVPSNRYERDRSLSRGRSRSPAGSVSSRSRSRSRSSSRSSDYSDHQPSGRGSSRRRDVRKRSRSPRGDVYRPGRGDRNVRGYRDGPSRRSRSRSRSYSRSRSRSLSRSRSRSESSGGRSPAYKRRRYSSSRSRSRSMERSRSPERRRRRDSVSSSRSRSFSMSRSSRSRSPSSDRGNPRRGSSRHGSPRRGSGQARAHGYHSPESDHSDRGRRHESGSRRRRRNSSSVSTTSRHRSRSADGSKDAASPTRPSDNKTDRESNMQKA